jgi:hypothetical protein
VRPENAVEGSILNVGVMSEGLGQRRLAVATGATQRGGDGDSIAIGVEQLLFQRVEFLGAFDESAGGSGAIMATRFCRLSSCKTRISVVWCSGRSRL